MLKVPTACPAGTASPGGTTTCTQCVPGTYSDVNGSTVCSYCPAGKSCLDRSAEPVACTNGTSSQLGDELCSVCAAGTYSGEEASFCLNCPTGYSCFNPTTWPILCSEGYISGAGVVRPAFLSPWERIRCHSIGSILPDYCVYRDLSRGRGESSFWEHFVSNLCFLC